MSGLSLMQTRSFIDRLGDLDEEITKVCRAADVMAQGAKEHGDGVARLKEACKALEDKQKYVREAKDVLLGLDGLMHALSSEVRQLMEHPRLGNAVSRISERMSGPLQTHVATIVEESIAGLRRVSAAVAALREAKEDTGREGNVKESVKALSRVCDAAENALKKAIKASSEPMPEKPEVEEAETEEVVVEKSAGSIGYHGYSLTAKELPPEFLENIKKKKEEAKSKGGKDEDKKEKGSDKKAESLTPGNKSKGPKDEGEEDEGWVPGHRTKGDEKKDGKKANLDHGYVLTAGGGKKYPELGGDSSTEGPDEGEDNVPRNVKDDPRPNKTSSLGYDLYEVADHGYELFS